MTERTEASAKQGEERGGREPQARSRRPPRARENKAPAPTAPPEDPRVTYLHIWLSSPAGRTAVPHRLAYRSAVNVLPLLSGEQRTLAWMAANGPAMKRLLLEVKDPKTGESRFAEGTAKTYASNVAKGARCRLATPDVTSEDGR